MLYDLSCIIKLLFLCSAQSDHYSLESSPPSPVAQQMLKVLPQATSKAQTQYSVVP